MKISIGRVAVVTGAGQGIVRAFSHAFASRGASVLAMVRPFAIRNMWGDRVHQSTSEPDARGSMRRLIVASRDPSPRHIHKRDDGRAQVPGNG